MARPTAVTVFGILNIIFGALGLLCTPFTLLALFMPQNSSFPNPAIDLMKTNEGYRIWMITSMVLGIIVSGILLAAGIGLLMLKPWGRKASVGYGIYAIVMVVITLPINYLLLIAPLMARAQSSSNPQESAGAMGGAIGGLFGGCAGLIYPVLLLVFMMQPNVVSTFKPVPAMVEPVPPPSDGPLPM
jgi:hypothetical protein